jgi:hypothetical protein
MQGFMFYLRNFFQVPKVLFADTQLKYGLRFENESKFIQVKSLQNKTLASENSYTEDSASGLVVGFPCP